MNTQSISVAFNLRQIEKKITTWIMNFFDESENGTQQKNILSVILLEPEFLLLLFSWMRNTAINFLGMLNTERSNQQVGLSEISDNNDRLADGKDNFLRFTGVEAIMETSIDIVVYKCIKTHNFVSLFTKKVLHQVYRTGRVGLSLILFIFAKISNQWVSIKAVHFKKTDIQLLRRLYC